jgi:hypothetical protein
MRGKIGRWRERAVKTRRRKHYWNLEWNEEEPM